MRSYRKEYDEVRKVFKNSPEHDWSSHPADAFRTLAMGIRLVKKDGKRQETAEDQHDYLR